MRAQAGNELALDALRRRLAAFHRIAHVVVEQLDQRGALRRIREVRIDDSRSLHP